MSTFNPYNIKVVIFDGSVYSHMNKKNGYKTDDLHCAILKAIDLDVPIQFRACELNPAEYNFVSRTLTNEIMGSSDKNKKDKLAKALSILSRCKVRSYASDGLIPEEFYKKLSNEQLINIGSLQAKLGEHHTVFDKCEGGIPTWEQLLAIEKIGAETR